MSGSPSTPTEGPPSECMWPMPHRNTHKTGPNCGCTCSLPDGHKGKHQCSVQIAAVSAVPASGTPENPARELTESERRTREAFRRLVEAEKNEGRYGSNGGVGCDVRRGPCSCGAWH